MQSTKDLLSKLIDSSHTAMEYWIHSTVQSAEQVFLLQAIHLLDKSRAMGIVPNTIMYNTAMSSLGKSGHWKSAETLFGEVPEPDSVTFETLIAAYGMAGQAEQAEIAFKYMVEANHKPRDYAYCGLIAAHR